MIKILRDCRCGQYIKMDCGDPSCCQWEEYDGIFGCLKGEEYEEWELKLDDLEEGVDYMVFIEH